MKSKALALLLSLQSALLPFATAQAAPSCPADSSSRKDLTELAETALEQAGGKENWSFEDESHHKIALSELAAGGKGRFFFRAPDGGNYYLETVKSEDGKVVVSLSRQKTGGIFMDFHRTEIDLGSAVSESKTQLQGEVSNLANKPWMTSKKKAFFASLAVLILAGTSYYASFTEHGGGNNCSLLALITYLGAGALTYGAVSHLKDE